LKKEKLPNAVCIFDGIECLSSILCCKNDSVRLVHPIVHPRGVVACVQPDYFSVKFGHYRD
jgi:hypothetical protein